MLTFRTTKCHGQCTKNLLKIRDEEVILIKKGTINSTMEFRNDDVFRGFYDTPYGALQMVLNTGLVQMTNDPDTIKELELEGEPDLYTAIEYELQMGGNSLGKYAMEILINNKPIA